MTAETTPTDRAEWPRVSPIRGIAAHIRAWVCSWLCHGYDRRAGRIVDGLVAEIDRLRAGDRP
jgi:hypothetical protein